MITTAKLQKTVVSALEDIKAKDISVFDVSHITALFDKVIIASAGSGRQLKALSNNVQAKVKAAGGRIYGVEGENSDDWMLVDVGDIIVHMMQPAMRAHYNLEELWNQPKPRAPRKAGAQDDADASAAVTKRPAKRAAKAVAGTATRSVAKKVSPVKAATSRTRKTTKPKAGA